ncbi:MAG: hypothetical protein KAI29_31650, partial [Cyclobacteriaceae bacterium]|nr:hypothetical protein [Cyclobacteriaceae bacterium]
AWIAGNIRIVPISCRISGKFAKYHEGICIYKSGHSTAFFHLWVEQFPVLSCGAYPPSGGMGRTPIISQTVIYSDKHYIQDSSIYQDMCLIQPEYGEQDTVITF